MNTESRSTVTKGIIGGGIALALASVMLWSPAAGAAIGLPIIDPIVDPILDPITDPVGDTVEPVIDPPPFAHSPPAGYTRVQQSDPNIRYSGGWSGASDGDFSGGTASGSSNAGALANFTFDGTAVRWIGRADAATGIAEVFLDGTRVATVDTYYLLKRAPVLLYSTSGLSAGTHTLGIKVTGRKHLLSLGTRIWVDAFDYRPSPDTQAPDVALTAPVGGTTVSGAVDVAATASDNVRVVGVQFRVDGARLNDEDTAAPYTTVWDTAGVADGQHTLTATARDAAGNTRTSAPVVVTVANAPPGDTTPPTVAITAPAAGATVSGTVDVRADANDNVGVAGVQFRLDGALLGAEDTVAPYGGPWNTTGVANGSHSLTATARDAAGNVRTSPPVTVTVSNEGGPGPDTTPPTVAVTAPAPGATVSGNTALAADAADNVGVVGVLFRVDGLAVGGEDVAPPYTAAWNSASVADGSHTVTAIARDAAGNTATSASVAVTVANGAGGDVTRLEEGDAALAYTGTWVPRGAEIASFSGGSATSSEVAGNRVSLRCTGTAVAWLGWRCEICGIARVTLDGATTEIDLYAAERGVTSVEVFARRDLADATHTLVIEVDADRNPASGGAHVVLDALDIVGEALPPASGTVRVEETSGALAYTGTWVGRGAETAEFSGGGAASSDAAGARVRLDFTGMRVEWFGIRCELCGIASVVLDGQQAAIDTYAPTRDAASVSLFRAEGLADAPHTLVIEVTGATHPASTGAHVVLDAIDVVGSVPQAAQPQSFQPGAPLPPVAPPDEAAPVSGGAAVDPWLLGALGLALLGGIRRAARVIPGATL